MEIKTEDISIVIQGMASKETVDCIRKVSNIFKGAQIIVSTWENSDEDILFQIAQFDVDIIKNKDPNENNKVHYIDFKHKIPWNLNRQLVSTYNGIKSANRKYVLKMRSDIDIDSTSFLNFWDKFQKRDENYSFFKHRILVPSFVTINPDVNSKYFQYQISDWLQFGLREDLLELYNVELLSEYDIDFYVNNKFAPPPPQHRS